MRVKSIRIEFEPSELGDPAQARHATEVVFEDGMWTSNGPVFSRIHAALHEVWRLIRQAAIGA